MKKYFLTTLILLGFSVNLLAQSKILAYLAYSDFNTREQIPYIETYLTVIGNSVIYAKNEKGKYQGNVRVAIAFLQQDSIRNFKKLNLLSDEYDSLGAIKANFIDQQRFFLKPGEYLMELELADNNDSLKGFKYNEKITIGFPNDKPAFSEIQLVESYTATQSANILSKSGYDLIPYVSKYFPENMSQLNFYTELYNMNKLLPEKEKFIISYYLEDFDNKSKLNDFSSFTKKESETISSFLGSFSISNLPTGNYNLCVEARNKENKLMAERKIFFQRFNAIKEDTSDLVKNVDIETTFLKGLIQIDSLYELLLCIRPISTPAELLYGTNQLKNGSPDMIKRFFYSFWKKRNALNPEAEWLKYKVDVDEANKLFGTTIHNKKGFNSDRGRVYLQYGPPDVRSVNEHEPTSFPYEIWQYNRIPNGQTNRRFVFYDPYLGSNDYRLIHSDARGELYDARWRYKIDERSSLPASQKYNLDNENIYRNDFGRSVDDLYRNPR